MRKMKLLAACAAGVLLVGALASSARADLKLEQTITGNAPTGESEKAKPATTKSTLYLKNGKVRAERADVITVFDAASGTITVINPKEKTYYVTPLASVAPTAMGGLETMVDFKADATVVDTKEEKKVAGKTAHRYKYVMTINMVPKSSAPPALAMMLPTVEISADQWTVESPDAATAAKLATASMTRNMPMGMGSAMKSVADKMAAIKGIPVEETQSVRYIFSPTAPDDMKAGLPKEPMVSTTKTVTLSEDALSDSLFAAPTDYKKTDAPKVPTTGA